FFPADEGAGMKPGNRFDGWLIQCMILRNVRTVCITCSKGVIIFYIYLLHTPKSPELPFGIIIITMVIAISGSECCLPPFVGHSNLTNHLYRERQPGDPWRSFLFIF